jgi:RHS repeat-associated protein
MNSNPNRLSITAYRVGHSVANLKGDWRLAVAVCIVVFVSVAAWAQADFEKGYQSYQSYHGTDFDTVNLANGNLVLNIPLLSYEQRGGLPPVVIAIRSNSTTFQSDPPFSNGPADTKQYEVASGVLGAPAGQPHVTISPGGLTWKEQRITLEKVQLSRFVAIDDSGATHSLGGNIANKSAPYLGNIRYSVDGSDLMLTASSSPLIVDRMGNIGGLVDPNGNAITLHGPCAQPAGSGQFYNADLAPWEGYAYGTASATYIVDSVGRTIPNPTYIAPVTAYSCIVDVDTPYYPANAKYNDPACPALQTGSNGQALATAAASDFYSFPSQNGGTVEIKFCYQQIQVHAALPNVARTTTTINETWPVLTAAILPNNTQWVFTYDPYGQVIGVTMPTGATTSYTYGGSTNGMRLACGNPPGEIPTSGIPTWPFNNLMSSRMVTQRTTTVSTSNQQWNYASTIGSGWGASSNSGTVTVTDLMGNDTVHTFSLIGTPTYGQPICGPYETNVVYYQGSSKSTTPVKLKQVATQYTSVGIDHANPTNFSNYVAIGVLPATVTTSLYDASGNTQVQQNANTYDIFGSYQDYKGTTYPFSMGQKLAETESDFGAGTAGSVLRSFLYTNQWQSNWKYWAANLVDLPCLDTTFTGAYSGAQSTCTAPAPPASQASQTSYLYDESAYVPSTVLGAQTTVTRWLNTGSSPSAHTFYNAQAMPTEKLDPNGNATYIAYDSTGLYPNKITHPQTGTLAHVEIPSYDAGTGELLSHTDENQNKTTFVYDSMRRLTNTKYPDGGSETFQYNDTIPPNYVFTKVLNSSSTTFTETGFADTLGRKLRTQISDSEGLISADTTYDSLGRVASQSNPYRSLGLDPTYGVTTFTYDALGRKTIETQPDGRTQQWCYQEVAATGQTNCHAQLAKTGTTASTGSYVDFQDESGNDWQRNSDGLGRLASVMEPNGVTATPSMQTTYAYDVLGNLLTVAQTGNGTDSPRLGRSFSYDTLSRLSTAANPESGAMSYAYDSNGNMLSRTQPLVNASTGTQTLRYCYDALNRKTAEYTGSQVTTCPSGIATANLLSLYTYDTTSLGTPPNNAIGHLTDEVEYTSGSSVWERSPYQYDTMGRLLDERQCTFGSCTTPYTFTYGYDYAGNVLSSTNGLSSVSNITLGYSYDNVARLATVSAITPTTGIWASSGFPGTLYTAKEYGPAGLVSASYGSSGATPMFLSRLYDNRLRVTDNAVYSASTQAKATVTLACIKSGCTPGTSSVFVFVASIPAAVTGGSSLAVMATNLAAAINSTDGMPVTATANGDVVTLTAIEYGPDGELPLIASAPGASFTATASGANLSGDTETTAYHYAVTYAANSNVASVTDTAIGNWTYAYDTLNRVASATASTAGIVTPWGTYQTQCWTYDSFGNRTGEGEMTAATACPNPITGANHSSWAKYNTSNQLTSNSTVANFVYDDAGNTTNDGINKYVYDLDGRICAVTTATGSGAITQYVYDAEGRRVAKGTLSTFPAAGQTCAAPTTANGFSLTGTGAALYLRGEMGDQDTELDGLGNWRHTNVFAGGGLTATYDTGTKATLSFNFSDWLGSKRLQSNFNGTTQNTWASDPFGSYLKALGTGADATEHHFTGKERDAESGNDYFGARYYESGLGRWISPDWSPSPTVLQYANANDPQSVNLYGYVKNNPVGRADADGHWDPPQHTYISRMAYLKAHMEPNERVIDGIRDVDGAGFNVYGAYFSHHKAWVDEQYSLASQAHHFLRDKTQTQMQAYNAGIDQLNAYAHAGRAALLAGNQAAADAALEGAGHLIQDSFAHTTRDGGDGTITHIQCFTCSSKKNGYDHHHPDLFKEDEFGNAGAGGISNEGQGSIDATASYLTLMNGAAKMNDKDFDKALSSYENQYFQQKLPQ